jgi:hypothetical protein
MSQINMTIGEAAEKFMSRLVEEINSSEGITITMMAQPYLNKESAAMVMTLLSTPTAQGTQQTFTDHLDQLKTYARANKFGTEFHYPPLSSVPALREVCESDFKSLMFHGALATVDFDRLNFRTAIDFYDLLLLGLTIAKAWATVNA